MGPSTERLGLSADATQKRIQVARASRRFPRLLDCLTSGRVHLSGLNLLAPHLTADNVEDLLERAAGKSKREIEVLIAEILPRPDVASRMSLARGPRRRLDPGANGAKPAPRLGPVSNAANDAVPAPCQDTSAAAEAGDPTPIGGQYSLPAEATCPISPVARPAITPLSPARYKVQFTANQELHDKIERARELLAHRVPGGDLGEVFDRVLSIAVAKLERERFALTDRPRTKARVTAPGSRHIPAEVKRRVYRRDGGQCTYVDGHGHRCTARSMLEYDHIVPYALGGPATFENTRLRCATHNRLEAEEKFGAGFMAQKRLFG